MALTLVTAPATEPLTVADVKAHLRVDSTNGEPAPTLVTAALAAVPIAGNLENGTHRYLATFVTADGETEAGLATAAVTVTDKTINGKIELTAIPLGGSAVTSRKIYRQFNSTGTFKLQSTIANNTATTLTDNTANASLGADAPSTNTTADPELVSWIAAAREYGETFTHRAFLTQTWDDKRAGFPSDDVIWLPKAPLISVTSVTYIDTAGDSQTWSASLYTVDAPSGPKARLGCIVPNYGEVFPSTRAVVNAMTVRFVAGYGAAASTVPTLIKVALKEHVRASRLRGDADESQKILDWVDRQLWGYKAF